MRHMVMYSASAYRGIRERNFSLHEDAIEFAEDMLKQVKYVWLLEYGTYKQKGGRRITSWIYHWWSPAVTKTDWGECPYAGWGRPCGRRFLIEYEPLLYQTKGSAHLNVRASPTRITVEAPSNQTERTPTNAQGSRTPVGVDGEPARVQPEAAD